MNRLPAELIDFIIDFHHSNRGTLKLCSLVCRKWLPSSRFHLFGTIIISNYSVHPFVKLLASPFSTITTHVHTLRIYTFAADVPVFDIIAPYFKDLVALKSVTLGSRNWDAIRETTLFKEIAIMELTGVSYNCYSNWTSLSFTLNPSSFSSTLRVPYSAIHGRPTLSWLPIVVQLPTFGQLVLLNIREGELPAVRAILLKSGGQSIHTIKLKFHSELSRISLVNDCVDLTHFTNLRSLSITLTLHNSKETGSHSSLSKIIQRILSPSFTHIKITVSIFSCMDLAWLDCEKTADELNHPRFSELQKVHVDIICLSDCIRDEAIATVHRGMSCLDNPGVLTVSCDDISW